MSITVTRDRRGTMKHVVKMRAHAFAVDESAAKGGEDELLAVAGKCPVHKLMTQVTTEVRTELAAP